MGGIFLRIYGGMMLAMLLIGLSIFALVQFVNDYRSNNYRHDMAQGPLWLVANGTVRYQPEFRKKWLDFNSNLLDMPFTLVGCAKLTLSRSQQERITTNRVVVDFIDENPVANAYIKLPSGTSPEELDEENQVEKAQTCLTTEISNVFSEQVARAMVVLVLDELGQYDQREWGEVLDDMQTHFAYPIERVAFDDLSLDDKQVSRLKKRDVVTEIGDGTKKDNTDIWVYSAIGNTGEVLRIGPVKLFNWLPVSFSIAGGVMGLVLMGLAAYFLIRPLQKRLRKMELAVSEVGNGNFDVRVDAKGKNAIGQLANAFNGMTERINQLVNSQQEMIRAVSHELRTPVARLRFGLAMLVDEDNIKVREKQADALDEDIDELDTLIDEVLTYARLEQSMPEIEYEFVSVAALVEEVFENLQPIADAKGCALQLEIDSGGNDVYCSVHPRYWVRAIQNLVSNAIKYGDSTVLVRVMSRPERNSARVVVEDDGPGIEKEKRQDIFEPFSRLDSSRTRSTGGYGLGLSIVKRIAEWHGGKAAVTGSDKLGGAKFIFQWPVYSATQGSVKRGVKSTVHGKTQRKTQDKNSTQ